MKYGKLTEVVAPEGTPLAAGDRFRAHVPAERNRDGAPRGAAHTVREDGLASSHDRSDRSGTSTVRRCPRPRHGDQGPGHDR
ncbi:hypothetical protein OYE22_02625 [Streptomyces sp. 71268]|uniref:hypothetical protein n=1 Tax=Streptomyces sp. 71268 TaxID=3002640 RepID=UPI0023F73353|nr:hypothetical protein [Streptomyces sp. 71268]WEV24211.1 hypothetical protein OYE22_02625 [Streptomyces sp. 71268]